MTSETTPEPSPELQDADTITASIIQQTAEEWGALTVEAQDDNTEIELPYSIIRMGEWGSHIIDAFPLEDWDALLDAIHSFPVPVAMTSDPPESRTDQYAGEFLRVLTGRAIIDAYVSEYISDLPPELFEVMYSTPCNQSEPVMLSLYPSAFGALHPEVDYETMLTETDALDLVSAPAHLEWLWVVEPDLACDMYEALMTKNAPVIEDSGYKSGHYDAPTAYGEATQYFIATFLCSSFTTADDPLRTRFWPDGVLESIYSHAGFPHSHETYRELLRTVNQYVNPEDLPCSREFYVTAEVHPATRTISGDEPSNEAIQDRYSGLSNPPTTDVLPESLPDAFPRIGKHDGGKWHLLGEIGCMDGDAERVEEIKPFFDFKYTTDSTTTDNRTVLSRYGDHGVDFCRRCFSQVNDWERKRIRYRTVMERDYDGGESVTWGVLPEEEKWRAECSVCEKPSGATHQESTFGQTACPSCLMELSRDTILLSSRIDEPASPGEFLSRPIQTNAIESWETRRTRRENKLTEWNQAHQNVSLERTGLTENKVGILNEHGYETVGDVVAEDPETLSEIKGLGRRFRVDRLPLKFSLDITTIEGVGDTIYERLTEEGYGGLPELTDASIEDLTSIRGISERKAKRILTVIEKNSTQNSPSEEEHDD